MQSMRSVVRCGAVHTSIGWVQRNGAACGKLGFNNRDRRDRRRTELIKLGNNHEQQNPAVRSKESESSTIGDKYKQDKTCPVCQLI